MTDSAPSPYGRCIVADDPAVLHQAVEIAFDYRGDVTVVRVDGEHVEGYVFDRRIGETPDGSTVRLIVRASGRRRTVPLSEISEIHFSGRDTAAGKSFETWMRKYVEKKLAGETASIESEPLDDC